MIRAAATEATSMLHMRSCSAASARHAAAGAYGRALDLAGNAAAGAYGRALDLAGNAAERSFVERRLAEARS
jgi:predicted RNA polymerase sigma factor